MDSLILNLVEISKSSDLVLKESFIKDYLKNNSKYDEDLYIEVAGKLENEGVSIEVNMEEVLSNSTYYSEDTVKDYLISIGGMSLLSADEEKEYSRRAKSGDKGARDILVERNLRLVVSIAKRYIGKGIPFLDLIQEGNIGLMRAVDKFDPDKGYRFTTYATWWVRQSITRSLADSGRIIRVPVHVHEKQLKMGRFIREFLITNGREPSFYEISEGLGISVEKVEELMSLNDNIASLDSPINEEDTESTLGDFITDDSYSEDSIILDCFLTNELERAMDSVLSGKEKDVLRLRFGLDGKGEKTLEEVGGSFEVTRERIRQIEAKALRKLRMSRKTSHLKEYVC